MAGAIFLLLVKIRCLMADFFKHSVFASATSLNMAMKILTHLLKPVDIQVLCHNV